jgi:hypothetical protein
MTSLKETDEVLLVSMLESMEPAAAGPPATAPASGNDEPMVSMKAEHDEALLRVQLAAAQDKLTAYENGYKHCQMAMQTGGTAPAAPARNSESSPGIPGPRVKKRYKYNPFCQCQMGADGLYDVKDSEIIGGSAYIFFLGFAPLGWIFALLALSVQCVAIVVFWFGAQKTSKNSEYTVNTDFKFGVPTCFPKDHSDAKEYPEGVFPPPVFKLNNYSHDDSWDGEVIGAFCDYDDHTQLGINVYVWWTGLAMLVVLFLPGVAKGLQLFFRGPNRWPCALANIVTPIATIVVAYSYLKAVARSPTDVLTAVFIITFINDFDESVYAVLNSIFPLYVKDFVRRLNGANAVAPTAASTSLHIPAHAR